LNPTLKALFDVIAGALLFAAALLPMLAIGIAILIVDGWPVLIRQRRIGQRGREYRMWKFRTLPRDTPQLAKSRLGVHGVRPSSLGRLLRRYSLDELPQLVNVLTRQMSLVGPRPALFNQDDLTTMRAAAGVLIARPGLTGLAQISGREDLTLEQKVALDAEYVRRMSIGLDIVICFRTLEALLHPRGNF
jgi:O-antigen biosynthesis protein WbqP